MLFQKGNTFGTKSRFTKGKPNPRKGKPLSDEHKRKLKESYNRKDKPRTKMFGENNPAWKGGKVPLVHLIRKMYEYRQWRSDVYTRDDWTCQSCGLRKRLEAHHIKPFSFIIEEYKIITLEQARLCDELWNINNGQTLCIDCHKKTDSYAGRGFKKLTTGK